MLRWGSYAIACSLSAVASAGTLTVMPGQSIQAAIDAAQPGDEIHVHPGTYFEALLINNKAVAVIGIGGAGVTTIDVAGVASSPVGSAIRVFGTSPTRVSGLRITHGSGFKNGSSVVGGGIYAPGANLVVEDCVIEHNEIVPWGTGLIFGIGAGAYFGSLGSGGATHVPRMVRCIVRHNGLVSTPYAAGGVYGGRLDDCRIEGNKANVQGGGVALVTEMRGCRVIGNTAGKGGGVYAGASTPGDMTVFSDTTIEGNHADVGGGLFVNADSFVPWSGAITVEGVRFIANTASATGGGLELSMQLAANTSGYRALIRNCWFTGNQAPVGGGSGLRATFGVKGTGAVSGVRVELDRCSLSGDQAALAAQTNVVTNSILDHPTFPLLVQGGSIAVHQSLSSFTYPGSGSLGADPLFVDAVDGDLHLTAASPAIGLGTATANGVATTDLDGDAPVGAPDAGADEFSKRLYVHGDPRPGSTVNVRVVGIPGELATMFVSQVRLSVPLATHVGAFELGLPVWFDTPIVLGTIPPSGVLSVPVVIGATIPAFATAHAQVLLNGGLQAKLTNAVSIVVL